MDEYSDLGVGLRENASKLSERVPVRIVLKISGRTRFFCFVPRLFSTVFLFSIASLRSV